MLGKLLKYEIKATARIFLPLFAVLIAFTLINKVISDLSQYGMTVPKVISMIVYVMIMVGVFVMTLVVTIQRFYKNLLSDEGYLMFTLPTLPWKLIISKLLISMMWCVASLIAAAVSVVIMTYEKIFTAESMQTISDAFASFFKFFGGTSPLIILEAIIFCVISLAAGTLIIYASIALGHLFNKHRILASLGAFIALSMVSQIVVSLLTFMPDIYFFGRLKSPGTSFDLSDPFFHFVIWCIILVYAILSAGYYFLTNYVLSRKLNLE